MAVTFVGSDTVEADAGSSDLAFTLPAGWQADDFAIIHVHGDHSGNSPDFNITPILDWPSLNLALVTAGRDRKSEVFTRRLEAGDGNPTFTTTAPNERSGILLVFRGVDDTTALDVTFNIGSHRSNGQSAPETASDPITTVTDNAAVVLLQGSNFDAYSAAGAPSGYTLAASVLGQHRNNAVAYLLDAGTAGTETPGTWTHTVTDTGADWISYTLALRPAPSSGTTATATSAGGTGTGHNATVSTSATVTAETAGAATGTAQDPTPAVAPEAQTATGTGTAHDTSTLPPFGFVSDDFNASGLADHWTFVDPRADTTWTHVGFGADDARLQFTIPSGGLSHNSFGPNRNSPWLAQAINDVDFVLRARWNELPTVAIQSLGFIVALDLDDWAIFQIYHDGTDLRGFAATTVNGTGTTEADIVIAPTGPGIFVRLERTGDDWLWQWADSDGPTWNTIASFTHAIILTGAGPFIGTHDPEPGFVASIDWVESESDPLTLADDAGTFRGAPAQTAAGSGTAHNATVAVQSDTTVSPTTATGTGTSHQPVTLLATTAETAQGTGTGHDATVIGSVDGTGQATTAAGTGTAHDATTNSPVLSGFVSDDFNSVQLGDHWTLVDPLADATTELTGVGGDAHFELTIPPGGSSHNSFGPNRNSPWLAQVVDDVDIKLVGAWDGLPTQAIQSIGFIFAQDLNDWVIFQAYHDGTDLRAFAATTTNGTGATEADTVIAPTGDRIYLRVHRTGDTWSFDWSNDGTAWTPVASFTHALVLTGAGPHTGTHTPEPGYTSRLDYVEDTAAPLAQLDDTGTPGGVDATTATGTGTSHQATTSIAATGGQAAGTGTGHDATISTVANTVAIAETAAGTGTAHGAPDLSASLTLIANNPIQVTGTAHNATTSATAQTVATPGTAAGTGTAHFEPGAVVGLTLIAENPIEVSGTAHNAFVPVVGFGLPDTPDAAGTAHNATIAVTATPPPAGGTGTAENAGVSTDSQTAAMPTPATGTGTGHDATVATSGQALAGTAAGTGTANNPTASIAANTSTGAGTGTAHDAAVSTETQAVASAGTATGTGTGQEATTTIVVNTSPAAGAGTGHDPTIQAFALGTGQPPAAAGTGTGHNPSVRVAFTAGTGTGEAVVYQASIVTTGTTILAGISPNVLPHSMIVVHPARSTDAYNNQTLDYGTDAIRSSIIGWLQQDTRTETFTAGRDQTDQRWLLITNSTELKPDDRIEWMNYQGALVVFHIHGHPEPAYRGLGGELHHIEATLRIETG